MAFKVYRRKKVYRTQFKKLRNSDVYYLQTGGTGPFVRTGRRTRLNTDAAPTTANQAPTQLTDVSVIVQRVPGFLLKSNHAI